MKGELGIGSSADHEAIPVRVGDESDWIEIATGPVHSCGIRADGTLWCWGQNPDGQLGLGDVGDQSAPQEVLLGLPGWMAVTVGAYHTSAIGETNASLWSWGYNFSGNLGTGDTDVHDTPAMVGSASDWMVVAAGSAYTCGVRSNGSLWCWGSNSAGQLGIGDQGTQALPMEVGSDTDWRTVSAGGAHTCAIRNGGTLSCWGNRDGNVPVQIGSASDWATVSEGGTHTCGLRTDASMWCWGSNDLGQLGVGDTEIHDEPTVAVIGMAAWQEVAAGGQHTCGIRQDGSLWCWGSNSFGEIGIGSVDMIGTVDRSHPIPLRVLCPPE